MNRMRFTLPTDVYGNGNILKSLLVEPSSHSTIILSHKNRPFEDIHHFIPGEFAIFDSSINEKIQFTK